MESYVKYDNGVLWTCSEGAEIAPAVLLCNGGPGCCDYLRPVADMPIDEYRIIRFEQRGCGRSTADGKYDLATAVEDIERIRKHYGIEQWIVEGHSWGANLALVYAMMHPERTRSLLYIAGSGIYDNRHWSNKFHNNLVMRGEQLPEMDFPFNADVNTEGNRTLRQLGRAPDFYTRIAGMKTPALFVMAENDIRPSWPVEQLANLMPMSKYITIEDSSHYIWLDMPEKMRSVLLDYLHGIAI